jgi:hypothetical protein
MARARIHVAQPPCNRTKTRREVRIPRENERVTEITVSGYFRHECKQTLQLRYARTSAVLNLAFEDPMIESNYFRDNEDLALQFKTLIDWNEIVPAFENVSLTPKHTRKQKTNVSQMRPQMYPELWITMNRFWTRPVT